MNNVDTIHENKKYASAIMPTGSGKSFVAITELLKHQNEDMIYLAPNNEILNQIRDYVIKYIHGNKGTLGKSKDEILKEVFPNLRLETYQALLSKKSQTLIEKEYRYIILDELHRTGAEKWNVKLNQLLNNQKEDTKVLGVTATPTRDSDNQNMSNNIALELGYTEEEVLNNEHIAIDMELTDAIELGLVVNPKVVSCEYNLEQSGKMQNLLDSINKIKDEKIRNQELKKYEELRRKVKSAKGVGEIMQENTKIGGKYMVFLPQNEKGEESVNGIETVEKYKKYILDLYKNTNKKIKFTSMLGAYSDKKNEKELEDFQNGAEDEITFMLVINKANEGLHVDKIDGLVWFRALDENSRTLYLQQLGRVIYGEDPNNPTKEEDRPVVIDFPNNTLNVKIDKDNEKQKSISDLEQLKQISEWIVINNGLLPQINSNNREERIYADKLQKLQEKYIKYVENFKELQNLKEQNELGNEEDYYIEIIKIIEEGRNIGLWEIEFEDKQEENSKKDENNSLIKLLEVSPVMRDFYEFNTKIGNRDLTQEILEFIEKTGGMPKNRKNPEDRAEKDERNLYGRYNRSELKKMVDNYKNGEEIPGKYKEAVVIIAPYVYVKENRDLTQEILKFIEKTGGMPKYRHNPEDQAEIDEKNLYQRYNRSELKKMVYNYKNGEKIPEEYKEAVERIAPYVKEKKGKLTGKKIADGVFGVPTDACDKAGNWLNGKIQQKENVKNG